MKYRKEIDGLRAIAVIPVVLFHAGSSIFRGGFVGVDVFFVISGYLICSIISREIEVGRFSFGRFYERRARRILPALLLVVAASIPFAWLWMMPADLTDFFASAGGVILFASNVVFWLQSGYFDQVADLKPLLHTWSLAVEEQFYIVFPILLIVLWKGGRKWVVPSLALLFVASLALCQYASQHDPEFNFYWAPTRAWELMAGAICSFLAVPSDARRDNILSLAGLLAVVATMLVYNHKTPFPSLLALPTVIGTCLVLVFAREGTVAARVLSQRILVGTGLISYSLYLWHQPLLALARHRQLGELPAWASVLLVAAAFGLAYLTWRFVETPCRDRSRVALKPFLAVTLGVCAMILAGSGYGYVRRGFPERFSSQSGAREYLEHFENSAFWAHEGIPEKYRHECDFYYSKARPGVDPLSEIPASCHQRDPAVPHALFIWGDSYAQMLNYGLRSELPSDWQILQVASSACVPAFPGTGNDLDYCNRSNRAAVAAIAAAKPDVVLVGQIAGQNAATMTAMAQRLQAIGVRKVIFTGPAPHWNFVLPAMIVRRFWDDTPQRTFMGLDRGVMRADAKVKKAFAPPPGVTFFSIMDAFCNQDGCLTYLDGDRKTGITTWDVGHLTPLASVWLARHGLADLVLRQD